MRAAPLVGRRGPIRGRPHEWMPEPDAPVELDKAGVLRGNHGGGADSQPAGGLLDHGCVPDGFGRCDEQSLLGLRRQRPHAPQERLLDPVRQLWLVG